MKLTRVRILLMALILLTFAIGTTLISDGVEANHPVLVEGNNGSILPNISSALNTGGVSGDWDGDGLVGTAEDLDNAGDRIFGTLTAAFANVNGTGANNNGHVIIVSSGRFNESLTINQTGTNVNGGTPNTGGVMIVEAAPGIQANIDAILQGENRPAPNDNATRQASVGLTVNDTTPFPSNKSTVLRNLVFRNWQTGVMAMNQARVTLLNCRFDSNVQQAVLARNLVCLEATGCSFNAGGQRFVANPAGGTISNAINGTGNGITYMDTAFGSLYHNTITGNQGVGVVIPAGNIVVLSGNNIFDNVGGNVSGTPTAPPTPQ